MLLSVLRSSDKTILILLDHSVLLLGINETMDLERQYAILLSSALPEQPEAKERHRSHLHI